MNLSSINVDAETAAALDAANRAFSTAYRAGDAEAIIAAYTADGIVLTPSADTIAGSSALREFWAPIGERERPLAHELRATLRQMLAPGIALELGDWRITRRVDGQEQRTTGCYTLIWRQSPEGWLIHYDSWTPPQDA
jgi:ketosteroid isomerase-like protein